MATYVGITDSQTDPDAPLTSDLGKAWTNNLLATAEGASGAPRHAVKVVSAYSSADISFVVNNGYTGAIIDFECIVDGNTGTDQFIKFALSDNNGSTYAADTSINIGQSVADDWNEHMRLFVDFDTGAYTFYTIGNRPSAVGVAGTGTMTLPSGDVNRMVFRLAGTDEPINGGFFAQLNGGATTV